MNDDRMVKIFWTWDKVYPVYSERMAAMSHPSNVANAFIAASFLFLQPKE